jgi:hypothetical protein
MPVVFLEEHRDRENVGGELIWYLETNVFVNGAYGPTLASGPCPHIIHNRLLRLTLGKDR